ncbi:MarR family transcriptional regulator [Pseudooceanicola nitratireducens]|uniref:MarR family transcriptional regulator n=1 Tax=Pseudooceanicola nitratireducens TaxID=517719 RepID=UPI00333E376C
MNTPLSSTHIIVTGDLVASRRLEAAEFDAAQQALRDGAEALTHWLGRPCLLARHRGDGWQLAVPCPAGAPPLAPLRVALVMRAALVRAGERIESRMALATGPAEIPEDGDLNRANGPAFIASGQLLDQLKSGGEMADAAGGAAGAATSLADHISRGWTQAQARSVFPMLAPDRPTQEVVAAQLGISRQAVRQALNAAGFPAIARALAQLEATP